MEMNFCRRCGAKLQHIERHVYRCEHGHTHYANSYPSVGMFVFDLDGRVCLGIRGIEPWKGGLDTFCGFLDTGETLEDAAVRELREESNLQPGDYEPLQYLTSAITDYPYGGESLPNITAYFYTWLKAGATPKPADDVAEIRRIALHDINPLDIPSDDTSQAIRALQRLFPENGDIS